MKKSGQQSRRILIGLVLMVLVIGCEPGGLGIPHTPPTSHATPIQLQNGDTVATVIQALGIPDHQFQVPGPKVVGRAGQKYYGLQWGVKKDGLSWMGDMREAKMTVWFDDRGHMVEHVGEP